VSAHSPESGAAHESDRDRFEALYVSTRLGVLAYLARRTAQPADAADLLAEVYLTAWRRIDEVPPGDQGRLWTFGVARRVLANHHRRTRTRTGLASALEATLRADVERDRSPVVDPRADAVAAGLEQLGEDDRELLTLTAWEGFTPAEIALVVGVSASTVRVRLHRARQRLGAVLADPEAVASR
jgi:RNA polymerase sigma factor (sigma-70 family)